MASRKKTREFQTYAEALARAEELAASGDQESDEFLAAVEAATRFFLRDRGSARFNPDDDEAAQVPQRFKLRKWKTIKDLLKRE